MLGLWNNILKFALMRLGKGTRERLYSGNRLAVKMLRTSSRRLLRFGLLQRLINRAVPCPQMVQRYIDPRLSIEQFFSILNQRDVRYTVLRWFEDLPNLKKGDDIDLLVHDDDLGRIKDLFVVLPTGVSCDIYALSAIPGASYRHGVPLYPSDLAASILDTGVFYKRIYRVPETKHYFLSLAYHAVYHKAESSGLPRFKNDPAETPEGERSYAKKLTSLGKSCGIEFSCDLQSLRELLTEYGWAPRLDVLPIIAKGSNWLTSLMHESISGPLLTAKPIQYPFDVYGVRVLVESDCDIFLDYVRRDFCFFHDPEAAIGRPDVRIRFLNRTPPWQEIPPAAVPLFKTDGSIVYKQKNIRYVDHSREVLSVYDLKRDQGTVYSADPDAMYRIAYSLLMTRIGLRLDRSRRHRMHTLGITIDEKAFLFLAEGGCGKTTLGLEMMKYSQVGWLTDDILAVDSDGRALAFPTSPRLIQDSIVPWLPPAVKLLKAPMPKDPPKMQLPAAAMLPRVSRSARLGALFLCRRQPGIGPSIEKVGFFEAFRGICDNALLGKDFGHMKAYHLQFSPKYVYRMAGVYFSRLRSFFYLARTVPVFRFEMGGQVSENAALLLSMHATSNPIPGSNLNAPQAAR